MISPELDYTAETLEAACRCEALFEQYDDETAAPANDDSYENLYPNVA